MGNETFDLDTLDTLTQKVTIDASSHWSRGKVKMSRTGGFVRMCSCAQAARLMLKLFWAQQSSFTVHRHGQMYGKQEERAESRLHDQCGGRAVTLEPQALGLLGGKRLEEEKVQRGYLNRGVDKLANSFTKITESRACLDKGSLG